MNSRSCSSPQVMWDADRDVIDVYKGSTLEESALSRRLGDMYRLPGALSRDRAAPGDPHQELRQGHGILIEIPDVSLHVTIVTTYAALMSPQVMWDADRDVIDVYKGSTLEESADVSLQVHLGLEFQELLLQLLYLGGDAVGLLGLESGGTRWSPSAASTS